MELGQENGGGGVCVFGGPLVCWCMYTHLYSCVPVSPPLTVRVVYPCFVWVGLLVCSQTCLCVQKCLDACGRQGYQLITQAETLSHRGHTAC